MSESNDTAEMREIGEACGQTFTVVIEQDGMNVLWRFCCLRDLDHHEPHPATETEVKVALSDGLALPLTNLHMAAVEAEAEDDESISAVLKRIKGTKVDGHEGTFGRHDPEEHCAAMGLIGDLVGITMQTALPHGMTADEAAELVRAGTPPNPSLSAPAMAMTAAGKHYAMIGEVMLSIGTQDQVQAAIITGMTYLQLGATLLVAPELLPTLQQLRELDAAMQAGGVSAVPGSELEKLMKNLQRIASDYVDPKTFS